MTVQDLNRDTHPMWLRLRGLVRRMIATATALPRWQLRGVRGADGSDEVVVAEVFQGIGFAARPPASSSAEAVVVNIDGQAKAPVVVATRDEKTAAAVRTAIGGLAAGDTLVFNASLIVFLRADGTVEIRSTGGVAKRLATLDDVESMRAWLIAHVHPDPASGITGAPNTTPPTPAGTTVLKGE